jgi:hypothetical protein
VSELVVHPLAEPKIVGLNPSANKKIEGINYLDVELEFTTVNCGISIRSYETEYCNWY